MKNTFDVKKMFDGSGCNLFVSNDERMVVIRCNSLDEIQHFKDLLKDKPLVKGMKKNELGIPEDKIVGGLEY